MLLAPVFVCIGFMIAILYIDLQFDMLGLPHRRTGGPMPTGVLGQVATYYGVITKNPYLLMFVMMTTLVCIIAEIVYAIVPPWAGYSSLVLILLAMGGGIIKVIPTAQRLATDKDTINARTRMVHGMFLAHIFLLIAILLLALVQFSGTRL
jgi:hypothetical protein